MSWPTWGQRIVEVPAPAAEPTNGPAGPGLRSLSSAGIDWSDRNRHHDESKIKEIIMTSFSVQRRPRSLFPDFSELLAGFPSFAGPRVAAESRLMPLEDELKDGRYEVRAEIPGVDPATDIDITVHDGRLTIKAERTEKKEFDGRSEFSYGSFVRTVALPAGADEDSIEATYDKGILTVSVAVSDAKPAERRIPIRRAN
ncbi:hypothetical protein NIIDMKKI_24220 [Mycobacterium kansasii]|uniref:SHSP domain-containing protein n=5 Tax=Mycobacterium kansasii TaxID=1768 RepID=A0A7G1I8C9_MYCKA|nr:hypothetical protein NIIDMKKI_24220 [Mycobacterium kansasii]